MHLGKVKLRLSLYMEMLQYSKTDIYQLMKKLDGGKDI